VKPPKPESPILPAVLLAVVTLVVFFVLQHSGPESAVRQFHEAAISNSPRALQQVTLQPLEDNSDAYMMASIVQHDYLAGARIRIVGTRKTMDKSPNRRIVDVVYLFNNRVVRAVPWIVVRERHLWKVDVVATRFGRA